MKYVAEDNAEWLSWGEKALRHIREKLGVLKKTDKRKVLSQAQANSLSGEVIEIPNRWERQTDHSLLVEIFLWEKRDEEAWQEATAGGCSEDVWRQLADAIAKEHPDRAYRVYQELIEPTIARTNNTAYNEAIKLLTKMHKLAAQLNREREFADFITDLRSTYKLKRNFIKLLDGMREWEKQ